VGANDELTFDGDVVRQVAPGSSTPAILHYAPVEGGAAVSSEIFVVGGAGVCSVPSIVPAVYGVPIEPGTLAIPSDRFSLSAANCAAAANPVGIPVTNTAPITLEVLVDVPAPFSATVDGVAVEAGEPVSFVPGETKIFLVAAAPNPYGVPAGLLGRVSFHTGGATRSVFVDASYAGAWISASVAPTGQRAAGSTVQQVVTLTNTGNRPGRVRLEHFETGQVMSVTVPAYAETQVVMDRTIPVGTFNDLIEVVAVDDLVCAEPVDPVSAGTGIVSPMRVNTTELGFEDVLCGEAAPGPRDIVVKNTAAVAITVQAASEVASSAFVVTPPNQTILAGAYGYVRVQPKVVTTGEPGARSEFVRIRSSDGTQQRVHVTTDVRGLIVTGDVALVGPPVRIGASLHGGLIVNVNTPEFNDRLSAAIYGDDDGEFAIAGRRGPVAAAGVHVHADGGRRARGRVRAVRRSRRAAVRAAT
jgi:hypothetical protein